jgi:hypothetical protein
MPENVFRPDAHFLKTEVCLSFKGVSINSDRSRLRVRIRPIKAQIAGSNSGTIAKICNAEGADLGLKMRGHESTKGALNVDGINSDTQPVGRPNLITHQRQQ